MIKVHLINPDTYEIISSFDAKDIQYTVSSKENENMANKLKDLFGGINNEKYDLDYQAYQEKLKKERENIVLHKEGNLIWKSEKREHFYGDCLYCSNFNCINCGTTYEQTSCKKYPGMDCGEGLTCKDNDFEENKEWDEFKKILKNAEEMKKIIDGEIYQASVCKRCGETHFSMYIGTQQYDGGYTRVNIFEPLPDGWGWGWGNEIGRLCPTCFEKYEKMKNNFMKDFMGDEE